MKGRYEVGLDIVTTERQIHRYMDSRMPIPGINGGQCRVLGFIRERTRQGLDTYQRDLESEFNIRRSSVTSVLNLLEKNGLIERQAVENDARLRKLVLTERGQDIDTRARAAIDASEQKMAEALTEDEIRMLQNILSKVRTSME